jgi:hypothetical protein
MPSFGVPGREESCSWCSRSEISARQGPRPILGDHRATPSARAAPREGHTHAYVICRRPRIITSSEHRPFLPPRVGTFHGAPNGALFLCLDAKTGPAVGSARARVEFQKEEKDRSENIPHGSAPTRLRLNKKLPRPGSSPGRSFIPQKKSPARGPGRETGANTRGLGLEPVSQPMRLAGRGSVTRGRRCTRSAPSRSTSNRETH